MTDPIWGDRHFSQKTPDEPIWVRQPSTKRDGIITFIHGETGKVWVCPAIWYNQTVEENVAGLDFVIDEREKRLVHWTALAEKSNDAKWQVKDATRILYDLRAKRAAMIDQNTIHPVVTDTWKAKVDAEIAAWLEANP